MLRFAAVLLLCGTCQSADADTLKEVFGRGVLGVPWGASLTDVVGTYAQGDHVFAVTPGCRAYWVKDGQTFLAVPRERNGVLFGFDKHNRVAIVTVAFPFERKDELRATLTSVFGLPAVANGNSPAQYYWRSLEGMSASVTEFGEADQRIVWLTITTPGYTSDKQACSE